jgi:glycosyltransferase involved in cell wall biosynthesis
MDGGSTDQTVDVLRSYDCVSELKWRSEPDNGVVDAVNKGLSMARGDIVAIQSSDDIYLPGAISAAVDFLGRNRDVTLTYGDVEYMDEYSSVTGVDRLEPFDFKRYIGRFTYIPQPSAFFRREVIDQVGLWRDEVSYAADADYWLRIAIRNKVAKIDRLMGRYRYHAGQRDTQKEKIARDWQKVIEDLLSSHAIDPETRRYARMGIYLAKHRYTPESDWMRRTLYLYRAAASNPAAVFDAAFPKRELLIGREPIWKLLSNIKRRMGLSPRTSAA